MSEPSIRTPRLVPLPIPLHQNLDPKERPVAGCLLVTGHQNQNNSWLLDARPATGSRLSGSFPGIPGSRVVGFVSSSLACSFTFLSCHVPAHLGVLRFPGQARLALEHLHKTEGIAHRHEERAVPCVDVDAVALAGEAAPARPLWFRGEPVEPVRSSVMC